MERIVNKNQKMATALIAGEIATWVVSNDLFSNDHLGSIDETILLIAEYTDNEIILAELNQHLLLLLKTLRKIKP